MRYLAIDWGGRRTGLAIGDDRLRLASPLAVLAIADPRRLLDCLEQVIQQQGPDALVLGLPLNMDDSEGPAARRARAFAKQLERRFGLRVYLQDERLSSFAAQEKLRGRDLTRGQKKQRQDALAAAELLTAFLQSH